MSEQAEYYRILKSMEQEAKKARMADGMTSLRLSGLPFEVLNNGYHVLVEDRFDYWPSTERWVDRQTGQWYRGADPIQSMLLAREGKFVRPSFATCRYGNDHKAPCRPCAEEVLGRKLPDDWPPSKIDLSKKEES